MRFVSAKIALIIFLIAASAPSAVAGPSIRFDDDGLDVFTFHGRVALVPPTLGGPVDPIADGFGVELSNDFGLIYQASLQPGDLEDAGELRYRFKDEGASYGAGSRDGLYHVFNRFRRYPDGWYYTVKIRAYGDFSFATHPKMTLLLYEVGGTAGLTADWVRTNSGWRLPLNHFPD